MKKLISFSFLSWLVCSIVLPCAAAQNTLPGQLPASGQAPSSPSPQTDTRASQLDSRLQEIMVMRAALAGQAEDGNRVSRILAIDYLTADAVDAKKAVLQKLVVEKRKALKQAKWSGQAPFPDLHPPTLGQSSGAIAPTRFNVMLAEYESLRLQLEFLNLPAPVRAAFQGKEAEALRVAEARVKEEEQKKIADTEAARVAEARRAAREKTMAARMDTDRAIARERASLEAVGAELTTYRNNLALTREQLSLAGQERLAGLVVLRNRSKATPAGSPRMDALYDDMVQVMQGARGDIASSLDSYASIPGAPRYRGDLSSLSPMDEEQRASVAALKKLSKETASSADKAEVLAADLAWSRLKAAIAWSQEVNALRLDVLKKASRAKRSQLLGITRDGIAQLKREITDLALFIRWSQAGGRKILLEEISTLKDPFVAGGFASKALWIVLLTAFYVYILRHGKAFLERLQGFLTDALRSSMLIRRMQRVFFLVRDLFNELVLLGAVVFSPPIIGFDPAQRYWHMAYAVALWYAAYRIVIKISLHAIDALLPGDQLGKESKQNRLLLQSILLTGRYILITNVILSIAETILGRGYLHHIVWRVAWIGAFIIFAVLIRWWRDGISDAYLQIKPSGTLAGFVQATRSRWYGFFVAIAAFGVLLIDTLALAFRRFVYSFEQSQRMLAYLFRRRLEKKALLTGGATPPPRSLPPEAARYFDEGPVAEPSMQVDFFPHMDLFTRALKDWKSGGHIGAFAIVGDFGFGKTTWLNEARRRADIGESTFLALRERATTRREALDFLASGLAAPAEAGASIESLSAWLRSGEKRLVIVDDLHFWYLRSIDSLEALHTFNTLVELTGERVFWLCSFSHFPYRFYSWATRGNTVFRTVVTMSAWPEETIETLLRTRTDLTGWRLSFDGLLLEGAEDFPGKTNPEDTAKDYNRLIWDLSLGSPRAAIQYWVNSLSVDEGGDAHVLFFKRPHGALLDNLDEQDRFVLACIVWHELASVSEITSMLRFGPVTCRDAVLRLKEMGVLRSWGDYHRVTAQWWPEVVRYLKRKHLVPSTA